MLLKALVYYYVATTYYAVAGFGYERFYGNSIFHLLNTTWGTGRRFIPLDLIFEAVESENVSKSQCVVDLRTFRSSLVNLERWSVQMADAWGGWLPGALSGNLINIGGYDECVSVKDVGPPAKYCWLKVSVNGSEPQNLSFLPHNVPVILSLCIPNTCSAPEVQDLISNEFGPADGVSTSVSCQERVQTWGPWEICGMIFFSLLVISAISSTVYDKYWATDYEGRNELWCSFSLSRNFKTLTADQPNKFSSIDGLRVLSQFVVIIYHICRDDLKNDVPVFNKFSLNEIFRSWGIIIVCFPYSVDTFSVIGGFLVMYSVLAKQGKKIALSKHIINKFMRIYPSYIVCLVLMLTLAGKMCDGPLCESIVYSRQDTCKKVWWTNVLCIHNIYPGLTKSCMSHTWYIAVDWQLFVVLSPLIILGIRENKKVTIMAIVGTCIASMATVFFVTVFYDLKTDTLIYHRASEAKIFYDALYTTPYSRLVPWSVGLLFGVFMFNQKKNKITLKKEQIIFFWGLTGLIVVGVVLLDLPFQQEDFKYNSVEAGLYNSLTRPLWSVAVCWTIFACSTGYGGPVNEVLSAAPFQLLGKLSYCAYLIHKLVVNLFFSNLRGPLYISALQQGTLMLGLIVLSFMASFVLYMLAEVPFAHIGKFLLQNRTREEKDLQIQPVSSQPGATVAGFDTMELERGRSLQK